jgi:hypothetical protein
MFSGALPVTIQGLLKAAIECLYDLSSNRALARRPETCAAWKTGWAVGRVAPRAPRLPTHVLQIHHDLTLPTHIFQTLVQMYYEHSFNGIWKINV